MKAFLQHLKFKLRYCWSWENLSPLNWSMREIKFFVVSFLAFMLPVYVFVGLQPIMPADASSYPQLEIPSINLTTPVATVELKDHQLVAPAAIAGVYQSTEHKTFIIGHSSTVFQNLHQLTANENFTYNKQTYQVTDIRTVLKTDIDMREILQDEPEPTIIIMTCAGEPLPNQDATHRLIVTAKLVS